MQKNKQIRRMVAFLLVFVLGTVAFVTGNPVVFAENESILKTESYTLKLENVAHGTVSFSNLEDRERVLEAGETYTIKATAEDGYVFKGFVICNVDGTEIGSMARQEFAEKFGVEEAEYTLIMPEGNIMVSPWIEKVSEKTASEESVPENVVRTRAASYMSQIQANIGTIVLADDANIVQGNWSEGRLGVDGVQAFCVDPTVGFQNSYCNAVDAVAYGIPQIEVTRCAMVEPIINGYSSLTSNQKYLMTQMIIWRILNRVYGWNYGNIHIAEWSINMTLQSQILGEVWTRIHSSEADAYIGKGMVYVNGYSQPLGRFTLENKPQKGKAKIIKQSQNPEITNGNSNYSLKGAQYTCYSDKACAKPVGVLTTDVNGSSNSLELDAGTYYVKETKSPNGYELDETVHTITVAAGQTATLNVEDVPIIPLKLQVVKKLKGADSIVIPGVEFKHTLPDGTEETEITDENGQVTMEDLTCGTHVIEETFVPDGYTRNPGKVTFTVSETKEITLEKNTSTEEFGEMIFTVSGDGSASLIVEDTYALYRLHLTKENDADKRLSGAEFAIYSDKECTREVTKGTTGEDGTLDFEKLQVGMKYYLKETKAPEGYQIPVNADGSAVVYEFYAVSDPLANLFEYFVNGTKHVETDGAYAIAGSKSDRIVNIKIVNERGIQMPKTGTHGRMLIVVTGISWMLGTFVYLLRKKEKNEYDKK